MKTMSKGKTSPAAPAKTLPAPTVADLEALRRGREVLLSERDKMATALVPRAEALARMEAWIDRMTVESPILIGDLVSGESHGGHFTLPSLKYYGHNLLVWLLKDRMRECLTAEIDRALRTAERGLPMEQRAVRVTELTKQLSDNEMEEERLICLLEHARADVWRRRDADVNIVLGVDGFTYDVRKARRLLGRRDQMFAEHTILTTQRSDLLLERFKARESLTSLESSHEHKGSKDDDYQSRKAETEQDLSDLEGQIAELDGQIEAGRAKLDAATALGERIEKTVAKLDRLKEMSRMRKGHFPTKPWQEVSNVQTGRARTVSSDYIETKPRL